MFTGTVTELSAIDVIQMLCLARRTTAVRFSEGASSGALYLEQGEPLHAVWDDLVGEEAFYRMLTVKTGIFRTAPLPADLERNLAGTWQYLLMEGTRRIDEARRGQGADDQPPRPASHRAPPSRPQRPEVPHLIDEGFALLREGRRDDARAVWEEALRLDPKNRQIELNLRKLKGAPAAVAARR